ncbi:hypothetical protein H9P43_005063 [Blastocladiella emersonii ATCC 22665]|nr:hypothetical protein H9P43_005063 [Blastocladiella emersonii ATCC 22665]
MAHPTTPSAILNFFFSELEGLLANDTPGAVATNPTGKMWLRGVVVKANGVLKADGDVRVHDKVTSLNRDNGYDPISGDMDAEYVQMDGGRLVHSCDTSTINWIELMSKQDFRSIIGTRFQEYLRTYIKSLAAGQGWYLVLELATRGHDPNEPIRFFRLTVVGHFGADHVGYTTLFRFIREQVLAAHAVLDTPTSINHQFVYVVDKVDHPEQTMRMTGFGITEAKRAVAAKLSEQLRASTAAIDYTIDAMDAEHRAATVTTGPAGPVGRGGNVVSSGSLSLECPAFLRKLLMLANASKAAPELPKVGRD